MTRNTSWSGKRRSFPTAIRRAALKRDPICVLCGQRPSVIADHRIAHAFGGSDSLDNAQGICKPCSDLKTRAEIARGRAAMPKARREPERHPGLR